MISQVQVWAQNLYLTGTGTSRIIPYKISRPIYLCDLRELRHAVACLATQGFFCTFDTLPTTMYSENCTTGRTGGLAFNYVSYVLRAGHPCYLVCDHMAVPSLYLSAVKRRPKAWDAGRGRKHPLVTFHFVGAYSLHLTVPHS